MGAHFEDRPFIARIAKRRSSLDKSLTILPLTLRELPLTLEIVLL